MSNTELETLLKERIVFDIGQLSKENHQWLRREVKARRVMTDWNCQRYPQGKRMYWIVD